MGFYGKIANSNKTAFSFDKVYNSRTQMELEAQNDGLFIGRYVLIEYDEPPVTAYFDGTEFYSTSDFRAQTKITPRSGIIYQDLVKSNAPYTFYRWNGHYEALPESITTSYAAYFNIDVVNYGRGFDSTAWMKTWDTDKNIYRYVLVAELNTIVPAFHMITDAPSDAPSAPYFDRDTTNIDYYLHAQAGWGHSVRLYNKPHRNNNSAAKDVINVSDEEIVYTTIQWNGDMHGNQYFDRLPDQLGQGDIYYNKAGFNKLIHTKAPSTITNTINYDLNFSGRKYGGGNSDAGEWNTGTIAEDMMEWYIHLPVIGDTMCEVWDVLYGVSTTASRFVDLAAERSDTRNTVTYDTTCVYGALNKMKDMLGYKIAHKDTVTQENQLLTVSEDIANVLYFTNKEAAQPAQPVIDKYYFYAYDPRYVEVTYNAESGKYEYVGGDETAEGTRDDVFFRDSIDGCYKHPNLSSWPAVMSDGTLIGEEYEHLYLPIDAWKMVELKEHTEDSIYGMLIRLHRLAGTYSPNVRDPHSIIGCINLVKDMIANVDKHLAPYKMVITNQYGQITTSATEYPYFATLERNNITTSVYADNSGDVSYQEILNSYGEWHLPVWYRLYTLDLMNSANNTKYFDKGYYGNCVLHELTETDTIGDAFYKLSADVSNATYIEPQILVFTADVGGSVLVENGRDVSSVNLHYVLNKGERQSISLVQGSNNVYTHTVDPLFYLQENNYNASKEKTLTDINTINGTLNAYQDVYWDLTYKDERDSIVTARAKITYANKVYWGIGNLLTFTNNELAYLQWTGAVSGSNSLQTTVDTTFKVTAGTDKYIYFAAPHNAQYGNGAAKFEVNGIAGGFMFIKTVTFTNESGYPELYDIWRSYRPNLGETTVQVLLY